VVRRNIQHYVEKKPGGEWCAGNRNLEIFVCRTAVRKNTMVRNRNTYVIKYKKRLEMMVKKEGEVKIKLDAK
jgi:hypothetical protein